MKFFNVSTRWFLTIVLSFFAACGGQKREQIVVINVLDKPLYDDCHIKGSINVPFDYFSDLQALEQYLAQQYPHVRLTRETPVVVYCTNHMCTASGDAAKMLKEWGFGKVWAYEAGMAEWYQKGLPIEGSCEASYLKRRSVAIESDESHAVPVISTEQLRAQMGL